MNTPETLNQFLLAACDAADLIYEIHEDNDTVYATVDGDELNRVWTAHFNHELNEEQLDVLIPYCMGYLALIRDKCEGRFMLADIFLRTEMIWKGEHGMVN